MKVVLYLLFGAIITLTVWVYFPGLSGSFTFDDNHNIADNNLLKIESFSFESLWQASLSSDSGPLKRPVSMFSFAVNHVVTGMDPWWMKLTNLFIHLINGFLVLLLMKQLFSRFSSVGSENIVFAPYVIAGLWLVHPINVTAVSYIVQRMTSLSATFVLLALYCYLKLREGASSNWRNYLLSLSVMLFWLLGLLSKETAILLSIYVFVIEWCMYGFKTTSNSEKRYLWCVWVLLALPWVGAFFYFMYDPSYILNGYASRSFTLFERLLTEFRVVSEYMRLILLPDVGNMGFFQDNIKLSTSLWTPITTLFSIVFLVGVLFLAISLRKRNALVSLGLLWFLGGHLLESTVLSIELMFLHRNYLPSIGLLLMAVVVIEQLLRVHKRLLGVTTIIVLLVFSVSTRSLAYQWSGDLRMFLMEVINNPDSVRANFKAGQVYKAFAATNKDKNVKEEYKEKALMHFKKIKLLDPYDLTGELCVLETYIHMGEVPPKSLIKELIKELPETIVNRGIINLFSSFKRCLINQKCDLNPEDFEGMIDALFNNKFILADSKRLILLIKAQYYFEYKQNIDAAITTVLEAIIWQGKIEDFVLLAQYYEAGGYIEEVKRTLVYIEKNDKLGRFNKFINDVKARHVVF